MDIIPFGKVTVATAGTPVQLTANAALLAMRVHTIVVSQIPGQTGNVYFGKDATLPDGATGTTISFLGSTGVGVLKAFAPAAASGFLDSFQVPTRDEDGNMLLVSEFKVDSSANTQALYAFGVRV